MTLRWGELLGADFGTTEGFGGLRRAFFDAGYRDFRYSHGVASAREFEGRIMDEESRERGSVEWELAI
jgi:hypothetical protein